MLFVVSVFFFNKFRPHFFILFFFFGVEGSQLTIASAKQAGSFVAFSPSPLSNDSNEPPNAHIMITYIDPNEPCKLRLFFFFSYSLYMFLHKFKLGKEPAGIFFPRDD